MPSKIDFYILEAANERQSFHFACELIEKIYEDQKYIYIHASTQQKAEQIDTLLWTFRDISFLPHQLYSKHRNDLSPIQIGWEDEKPAHSDTVMNLSKIIPPSYKQCDHLIEIVFSDPTVQQLARERYKKYRLEGYEINTHKLKATDHDNH